MVEVGLDPGNARDETVDFVLAKPGVFEGEFRGFDVKLGGAEMRDYADFGIGGADDRDLVLQRFRENSQFIGKPKTRATLSCTILRVSPSGMLAKFCATFLRE